MKTSVTVAEPAPARRPLQGRDYLALNVYWFALSYLWNSLGPIILPVLVALLVPDAIKGSALGLLTSVGLVLAVVVQPAAGAVSDRATFRWGRRRPILAGRRQGGPRHGRGLRSAPILGVRLRPGAGSARPGWAERVRARGRPGACRRRTPSRWRGRSPSRSPTP